MNSFIVVFAAALAVASAGIIAPLGLINHAIVAPAVKTAVIQGPGTSTQILGPDGSQIAAVAPGGIVKTGVSVGLGAGIVAPVAAPLLAPGLIGAPLIGSPLLGRGYPLLAPGSGLEGQYIPDISEKLYDDGSYKGEIYH